MSNLRGITKLEMLLAIAMSEFHQTTHVLFIPAGTHYTSMLTSLKNKKYIKAKSEHFFTLTPKAFNYIKRQQINRASMVDKEIDQFVDNL